MFLLISRLNTHLCMRFETLNPTLTFEMVRFTSISPPLPYSSGQIPAHCSLKQEYGLLQ